MAEKLPPSDICAKPTRKYPDGRTGTKAGYGAHRLAGEQACAACKLAVARYFNPNPLLPGHARPAPAPGQKVCQVPTPTYPETGPIGTRTGYAAHKKAGESPVECQECIDGANEYRRAQWHKHRETNLERSRIATAKRAAARVAPADRKPPSDLCAKPFTRGDKKGQPRTGTNAGAQAHKAHGEHPCPPCLAAERAYRRARHRKDMQDPEKREAHNRRIRELHADQGDEYRAKQRDRFHRNRDCGRAADGIPRSVKDVRAALIARDGADCFYCGGDETDRKHQIDHVVPAAEGGLFTWPNVVLACRSCNAPKSDKPLLRWLTERKQDGLPITDRAWALARGEIALTAPPEVLPFAA